VDDTTATALLALAEEISPALTGPDAKTSIDRLEARSADLVAAVGWFTDTGRDDEALRLANALYRYWITTRAFDEGARTYDRVLTTGGGTGLLRGRAYLNAGMMPFWLGDDRRAAELFERALAIGRRLDDAPLISQSLGGLVRVAFRTDVPDGRRLAHEALEVSEAAGDESGISNALHLLGVGAQIGGDLPEARDWMTRRLALVRTTGNGFLIASEASNLAMVQRQLGELDAAEALCREALEIERRMGARFTTPFAISGLASIALARGDAQRAAVLVGAVEAGMDATQMAWPPDERPHYEALLRRLPDAIGTAGFEQARAIGRSMGWDEAVATALQLPDQRRVDGRKAEER
jgi:non-specific serine/threonine protein kinase